MLSFFADELNHLRQRVQSDVWKRDHDWAALADEAAEMSAMAVHLLMRIEAAASRRQPSEPGMWDESAAREFLPLFRDWFEYASGVRDIRAACKSHGYPVEGAEDFLHAYNRAKMMALDFDALVASVRGIEQGSCRGRPLEEVANELRRQHRAGGG